MVLFNAPPNYSLFSIKITLMSNVPKSKVHKDAKGRIILDEEKYVEVTARHKFYII